MPQLAAQSSLDGSSNASAVAYIVDDEPSHVELLSRLARQAGQRVEIAGNAVDGMRLIRKLNTRNFIKDNNPAALKEIAQRFAEAFARGLWTPRLNSAHDLLEELSK